MDQQTVPNTPETARRQRFRGVVISAGRMMKTVTVEVERVVWHPKVRKQMRRVQTFLVHDPQAEAKVGDRVIIEETRPRSKRKHFRVAVIVQRSGGAPQ